MFPSNPFFASYVFLPLLILYFFTLPAFPPSSVRFPISISQPAPLSNLSSKALLPFSPTPFLIQSLDQSPTSNLSAYPPLLFSQQQSLCLTTLSFKRLLLRLVLICLRSGLQPGSFPPAVPGSSSALSRSTPVWIQKKNE